MALTNAARDTLVRGRAAGPYQLLRGSPHRTAQVECATGLSMRVRAQLSCRGIKIKSAAAVEKETRINWKSSRCPSSAA
jgi:hypothetical protein